MTDEDGIRRAAQDVLYVLWNFVWEMKRYLRKKWRAWKYPR